MKRRKTLVVGLGEVGGALAEVLEAAEPILRLDLAHRDFDEPIGVMHICFPHGSKFQFEEAALGYIERFKPELTIIDSTVVPGTTRRLAALSKSQVAFSPVRGKHVRMADDLHKYAKFVAAVDADAAREAQKHFQQAGLKSRLIHRVETLELAKLAETTYFGLLIAFAQEINRYTEHLGGDYFELTSFFDEIDFLPRTRYFPGFIGGHCVIPNIKLLSQVAPSGLFEAIMESNERRAAELQEREPKAVLVNSRDQGTIDGKVLAHR